MAPTKSTRSPAFQFYPRDFLSSAKVDEMSMTERGVYITLLSRCWLDNGLPTDMKSLAKYARMKPHQFERMWLNGKLRECFHERGGRFHNERLDRERKVQTAFRQKQQDRATHGWQSRRNAAALPDESQERHQSGNAPLSLPQSASSSASASAIRTPRSAGESRAPLHDTSHRKHAHCGRVCVHASLHNDFTRRRNHPDADKELRDFYLEIDAVWSTGMMANMEPGDPFDFWRKRYEERWPAAGRAPHTTPKTAGNVAALQSFVNRGRQS